MCWDQNKRLDVMIRNLAMLDGMTSTCPTNQSYRNLCSAMIDRALRDCVSNEEADKATAQAWLNGEIEDSPLTFKRCLEILDLDDTAGENIKKMAGKVVFLTARTRVIR